MFGLHFELVKGIFYSREAIIESGYSSCRDLTVQRESSESQERRTIKAQMTHSEIKDSQNQQYSQAFRTNHLSVVDQIWNDTSTSQDILSLFRP